MGRYPGALCNVLQRCRRLCKIVRTLYKDSPTIFTVVLAILLALVLLVLLFSLCLRRLVGARGTVVLDVALFWLFARLVARVLMFPGSFKLFQRNTEATFRTEMSRQYAHYLRQLWTFLRYASRQSEGALRGVSADGVARGCAVLETLTASFQMQEQQHEVKLSSEQELLNSTAMELQRWLSTAQVRRSSAPAGRGGEQQQQQPLADWLRQLAAGLGGFSALTSAELVGCKEEAARSIGLLEMLLGILDELRYQKKSVLGNALRFFRVPTVGSLNQLRTELQMRFGGHRFWVPVKGRHRLDAMYIPCGGAAQQLAAEEEEDVPLADPPAFEGPVLIWCNPNAAYYETMVYQIGWLNFWLSRGISLFFFNYAGYGRSTGKPSPSRIAEDGEAVIRFLRTKGVTQIGVYGRSIGGVAACHLARHHPDLVQLLVADRTMSTLETTAKCMYGWWASKALKVTGMMGDNVDNFWEVRAYKLLVVDPKDTMILDLASLRTAVALRVVQRLAPEERLGVGEEALRRLEEVWRFFGLVCAICESDEDCGFEAAALGGPGRPANERSARQPTFMREEPRSEQRLKGGDVPVVASGPPREPNLQWLEENVALVRTAMLPLADQLRTALDIVGENLEGGGVTLNDVFNENPGDALPALQSLLANLQVWGTLGDLREAGFADAGGTPAPYAGGITDDDMEFFLRKEADCDWLPPSQRQAELARVVSPEMINVYHRRLARSRVGQVRRDFRRRLAALQQAFAHVADPQAAGGEQTERLYATCLQHLREVESFVSALARFFKGVDLAPQPGSNLDPGCGLEANCKGEAQETAMSDSSDEKPPEPRRPQPAIDHSLSGHILHVDCGHNGLLGEAEMRHLALHLRAARFGHEPRAA